jgi:hypothetical protein
MSSCVAVNADSEGCKRGKQVWGETHAPAPLSKNLMATCRCKHDSAQCKDKSALGQQSDMPKGWDSKITTGLETHACSRACVSSASMTTPKVPSFRSCSFLYRAFPANRSLSPCSCCAMPAATRLYVLTCKDPALLCHNILCCFLLGLRRHQMTISIKIQYLLPDGESSQSSERPLKQPSACHLS